jgi:hypothetical protein
MLKPSLHPRVGDLDLSARGLLGLLDKGANHDQALSLCCEIDGAGNAVPSSHAYFPEFILKMIDMGPPDHMRAKVFEHLRSAQEMGAHVIGQTLEFGLCFVGDFYVPAHRVL